MMYIQCVGKEVWCQGFHRSFRRESNEEVQELIHVNESAKTSVGAVKSCVVHNLHVKDCNTAKVS